MKAIEEDWGVLQWLTSGEVKGLTLGRVKIIRGASNPRHCHTLCDEVLYLLSGKLAHSVGDKTVNLVPGDTLTIPAGIFHNATSIGEEDADMIVAYNSETRDFVLETP